MNLPYLALVAVAFLAMPAGFFIARVVPEELSAGRKWFVLLQRFLLIPIAALVFLSLRPGQGLSYASALPYAAAIGAAAALFVLNLVRYDWSVLPVFIALALPYRQLALVQASLVFLHGLPTGTLAFAEQPRRRELVLRFWLFWLLALGMFLLPP